MPFITISAMNDGNVNLGKATRFVSPTYYESLSDDRRARLGDILLSVTGSLGIAAPVVTDDPFVFQRHIAVLRPDHRSVESQFLLYLLRSAQTREGLAEGSTGTAQMTISLGSLRRFPIPLPPLAEQRRIVARIEALFARTRRARADLERIAPLSAKYRHTLLSTTFSQQHDDETLQSCSRRFFEVLDFKGGTQPPKATFSETPGPGRVRLLQIRDFASDSKAVYIDDSEKWSKCESDDILVGRYGASVGKILRGKAGAYNVALVKMIADWTRVDRDYLFNWLQAPAFQNCVLGVSRSAQNGFNKGDLASLTFPLLDLSDQKSIARRLVSGSESGKVITHAARHALTLLDRLEQSILVRAFRGELVAQEPEPSSKTFEETPASRIAQRPRRSGRAAA